MKTAALTSRMSVLVVAGPYVLANFQGITKPALPIAEASAQLIPLRWSLDKAEVSLVKARRRHRSRRAIVA